MLIRMWRKGSSFALLVGMQTGAPTLENSMAFPQKVKNRTMLRSAIVLLGIYPQDKKILIWSDTCTPMFITALSTITKLWKEPKCPLTDKQIKNMSHSHTHTHTHTQEYYLAIKRNGILPFATAWMELEYIMLSEISQRKTNTIWFHSCGI